MQRWIHAIILLVMPFAACADDSCAQVNHYDAIQRLTRQDHYDSEGVLRYTLTWEYDAQGNVIRETDAMGRAIVRRFDARGNQIYHQGPLRDLQTFYEYNPDNRLIRVEELTSDGHRRVRSFQHDANGHQIVEVDFFGNEWLYQNDAAGHILEERAPAICDSNGLWVHPITRYSYDEAGFVSSTTDPNGHTTRQTHGRQGITSVSYPDGTQESFEYTLEGVRYRSTARDGVLTQNTYDAEGRIVCIERLSPKGELLSRETKTYKGPLLMAETDAAGVTTYYTYDSFGRTVSRTCGERSAEYVYDSLGRRMLEGVWIDSSMAHVTRYHYDLLDRVLEKQVEDLTGIVLERLSYLYDDVANASSETRCTQEGPATTFTKFDAHHRPVKQIDALGGTSVTQYDDKVVNAAGQRVLQVRSRDALGTQTVVTHDALSRPVEELRQDPQGRLVAKHTLTYDLVGNLVRRVDTVINVGTANKELITEWDYDAMRRVLARREPVGTTTYRYNSLGQLESVTSPDGVSVLSDYDAKGRLSYYRASDRSFAYRYQYDVLDRIVEVLDESDGSTTGRQYDSNGNMVSETMTHGLNLQYQYDGLGRCVEVGLPDASRLRYGHHGPYLREVERLNSTGEIRYRHSYTHYDQAGQVMAMVLAGSAGSVTLRQDRLGRLVSISSPHFCELVPTAGYDAVGNLLACYVDDIIGEADCRYSYDALYQVTSEEGVASHRYRHDSLQNRLDKDGTVYQVNGLNQLVRVGNTHYSYDKAGRLATQEVDGKRTRYRYDALGRLTGVEDATQSITYRYDAFNRRISKRCVTSQGSTSRRYVYLDQEEVGAVDDTGQMLELKVLGQGKTVVAVELAGKAYAALTDRIGSIRALVNVLDGVPAEVYRYSLFGEEQIYTGRGYTRGNTTLGNPWRFSSGRVDPETGWIYKNECYYVSPLDKSI